MKKSKQPKAKRLAFLRSFFNSIFADIREIPPRIIPPGRLKMNLFTDDMSLSAAQRVVRYFGYSLDFSLIPLVYNPRPREYYQVDPTKRLFFLREFFHDSGLSNIAAAKTLGLTRDAISYWFKKDNIQISRIYDIALLFGADMEITIAPIKDMDTDMDTVMDVNGLRRTISLFIKSSDPLSRVDTRSHAHGRSVGNQE